MECTVRLVVRAVVRRSEGAGVAAPTARAAWRFMASKACVCAEAVLRRCNSPKAFRWLV